MKKLLFGLISLVVLLFVGFSTYYVLRNNEIISYTVSDKDTIFMNLGEEIESPVIHENKSKKTEVKVSLSNSNVTYDKENNKFVASKVGSTTITCVPTNTKFPAISFTIKVGDGSINNPYYIRNEQDLQNIGKYNWSYSSNYELVSDIILSSLHEPIGTQSSPFLGSFFGGEAMYTISNINIESTGLVAGFFGSLGVGAKIERLRLEKLDIRGSYDYAGAIAGENYGFIGQCYIDDVFINNTKTNSYTGGVVGLNKSTGPNAQISLTTFNGIVNGAGFVGGLIGRNEGGVADNCFIKVNSNLINNNALFGGLVGYNSYTTFVANEARYINAKFFNNITLLNTIGELGKYYTVVAKSVVIPQMPTTFTYYDMIMSCSSDLAPIGDRGDDNGLNTDEVSSIGYYKNLTSDKLSSKTEFTKPEGSSWNFDEFWSTSNNSVLFIDYVLCAGNYQKIPASATVQTELSTVSAVKNALELMRKYPSANLEFKIIKNLLIDYQGAALSPIGTNDKPFVGKLTTAEGVVVRIKNYTISSSDIYNGFFGVIQGNDTLISNIELASGNYSGQTVGGIVGFNNGATIQNCKNDSFIIDASATAGGLVAINSGNVINCGANLSAGYCLIDVNKVSANELSIGVVVGINNGTIQNVEAGMIKVNLYKESDKSTYIGGIAGKQNKGNIKNCSNYNLNIKASNVKGSSYSGGIVGYIDGGAVKNCLVSGYTATVSVDCDTAYAGGIAGFVGSNASIESCLFDNGNLTSKKAGGVAGVQYGRIDRCAVMATVIVEGYHVGGLTYDCFGIIRNSYSLATLKGSSTEAGFVVNLNINASVRFCYNYCAYTGVGTGYCETATNFRSEKAEREFTNNIVVGNNVGGGGLFGDTFVNKAKQRDGQKEVKIQTRWGYSKGSYVIVNESCALGQTAFKEFSDRGFDSNVWNIFAEHSEESSYLTLKDLPELPIE